MALYHRRAWTLWGRWTAQESRWVLLHLLFMERVGWFYSGPRSRNQHACSFRQLRVAPGRELPILSKRQEETQAVLQEYGRYCGPDTGWCLPLKQGRMVRMSVFSKFQKHCPHQGHLYGILSIASYPDPPLPWEKMSWNHYPHHGTESRRKHKSQCSA